MTGDRKKLIQLEMRKGCSVSLGDNTTVKIHGKGILRLDGKKKTKDVLYVEGLKHNLLSVSQMCDNGYKVVFDFEGWKIRINCKTISQGVRNDSNLYNLCEAEGKPCLISQEKEIWLWHKRIGHVNFDNIVKICSKGLVRNMPMIANPENIICRGC